MPATTAMNAFTLGGCRFTHEIAAFNGRFDAIPPRIASFISWSGGSRLVDWRVDRAFWEINLEEQKIQKG